MADIDVQAVQRDLWCHGAYWWPDSDITLEDACKLDLDHRYTEDALTRRRGMDANFDRLLQAHHGPGRELLDDTWGPATEHLLQLTRCPVPDVVPPAWALEADVPTWRRDIWDSMRRAATGSGSWPVPGCAPGHQHEHSIRINLDTSGAAAHWKRDLPHVIEDSVACYGEMGLRVIYVLDGNPREAEIEKQFQRIPGGVIGWNEFPQPGTCNQTISGRLDNDYTASSHMKAVLEVHETGHGVGLQHTRGGIMNPSILMIDPLTWKGDPHERTMARYFGGEPVADIDEPPREPIPAGSISGTITHDGRQGTFSAPIHWDDDVDSIPGIRV